MVDFGCFSVHQVCTWWPEFDRNNLARWHKRGYLVRWRRGLYSFPEYRDKPDNALCFAGRIYGPSYISCDTEADVAALRLDDATLHEDVDGETLAARFRSRVREAGAAAAEDVRAMISMEAIRSFYPEIMRTQAVFQKHLLREYVQLTVLDHLATTRYARKLSFIGGTSLRLLKGIDRFSEDLDFDCEGLDEAEFRAMTDDVLGFLARSGFRPDARPKQSARLTAFHRSIRFPGLLYELGLTGHREERFLLKIEAQDQGVPYACTTGSIKGCGLFFPFPVPPDPVLCAMTISAMLDRGKGRDCYGAMFLLAQTKSDYAFLCSRNGVCDWPELLRAIDAALEAVDLNRKRRDFEHLLFHPDSSRRILRFRDFVATLSA